MKKYYVGVDYSLNGPAICVHDASKDFSFSSCKFYYITVKKKCAVLTDQFFPTFVHKDTKYFSPEERYHNISNFGIESITKDLIGVPNDEIGQYVSVMFEDYAFSANGNITALAENCGILKYRLARDFRIHSHLVTPGTVKKFATGKGNATKYVVTDQFVKDAGQDLYKIFSLDMAQNDLSPLSDIADAFYVCAYHVSKNSNKC